MNKVFGLFALVIGIGCLVLAWKCLQHGNLGGTIPFALFGVILFLVGLKRIKD